MVAHEAGHFWAARKSGVEVEEFGIGFPPKAKVLTKKNGTEYTLNWLPLGGFVKLKGEHDADTTPGSFGAASLGNKVKIMLAGVVVNFLIAFLLFTVISLIGMPQLVENQFKVAGDSTTTRQDLLAVSVAEGSPAEQAGIERNDVIKSIGKDCDNDTNCPPASQIKQEGDLNAALQPLAGQEVTITFVRDNVEETTSAILLEEEVVSKSRAEFDACSERKKQDSSIDCEPALGYLGVVPYEFSVIRSTWSAPIVGAGTTVQFTGLTLQGLGSIVSGLVQGDTDAATEQVSGVLGVGFILSGASFLGAVFMLMIVAVISLSLAIMNVLPIPALDGGRLFVTLLYRLRNKPLTKEAEEKIHGTGFAFLMILFVLITIVDVQRFIL